MRVSSLFLTAVLVISTSSAWAAPKYREVEKLRNPVLQKLLFVSKELKKSLGVDREDGHVYRNTSLVMAVKARDTDAKALLDYFEMTPDVVVSEMEFSASAIYERVLRDATSEEESLSDLENRIDMTGLKSGLAKLKALSDRGDYEVKAIKFEDWQAHTELYGVVIYDIAKNEALIIGFTSLSW